MIVQGSRLVIHTAVPLQRIVVTEYQVRSFRHIGHYMTLLARHPDRALGPIVLAPLNGTSNFYRILDGHHRYLASVASGRDTMLAIVVYEPGDDGYHTAAGSEWRYVTDELTEAV